MSFLASPVIVLFLSMAVGYFIGRLRVGPIELGGISQQVECGNVIEPQIGLQNGYCFGSVKPDGAGCSAVIKLHPVDGGVQDAVGQDRRDMGSSGPYVAIGEAVDDKADDCIQLSQAVELERNVAPAVPGYKPANLRAVRLRPSQ